jgi:hypothetical protein
VPPPNAHFPPYPRVPHPSGQSRIRVDGKQLYLGKHQSEESIARQDELRHKWIRRRCVNRATLTIDELALLFLDHAKAYYVTGGAPDTEPVNGEHPEPDRYQSSVMGPSCGAQAWFLGPRDRPRNGQLTRRPLFLTVAGASGDTTPKLRPRSRGSVTVADADGALLDIRSPNHGTDDRSTLGQLASRLERRG